MERVPTVSGTANLLDILDRVLDKGLVIAGDIRVSLANVELLTIRIRLLVCSVDKAEQIGLNWWKFDPHLTQPVLVSEPAATRFPGPPPMGRVMKPIGVVKPAVKPIRVVKPVRGAKSVAVAKPLARRTGTKTKRKA